LAPHRAQSFSPSLPSNPFAGAEHRAQRHVEQAQEAQPKLPTPNIPRFSNPTGAQVHAALGMVRESQQRAVGKNPAPGQAAQYQREVINDPRQRGFLQAAAHYLQASRQQDAQILGGRQPALQGGNVLAAANAQLGPEGPDPQLDAALKLAGTYRAHGVSPGAAFSKALNEIVVNQPFKQRMAGEVTAMKRQNEPRLGLPLLGTIPARPILGAIQGASNIDLGIGGLPGKIANEVVDLPGQTLLSGAMAGSALAEALKSGNLKPAAQLGEGVVKSVTDPSEWVQHPVSSALMLGGAENVLGRTAGRVARTGVLGEKAASAASTVRPDLNLYGGLKVTNRTYNADPLRKGVGQVAYEKGLTKLPGELRQADPFQAEGWRLKRAMKGGVVKPGRVDMAQQAGERLQQEGVHPRVQATMANEAKAASAAQRSIFEGVATSPAKAPAQLAQRLADLQDAQKGLYPLTGPKVLLAEPKPLVGEALAHNLKAQGVISEALKHLPTADTFSKTRAIVEAQKPTTAGLLATGALQPEQLRASLFPYAQHNMGARYYTAADHQAAERAARVPEKAAYAKAAALPAGTPKHAAVLREAQELKGQRMTVSGRGRPEEIAAHEDVLVKHAEARRAVPKAQEALRRVEAARSRLVGRESAGGRSPGQDRTAAAGGGGASAAADARVRGATEALRAANAEHAVARNAAAASKLPEIKPGLRKANGDYLSTQEILDHMHANGVPHVGYVSQEPPPPGTRMLKGSGRRPPLAGSKGPRTGAAFINGTFDHSFGSLVGQTAKENTHLARHLFENTKAARFGIGGPATKQGIEDFAKNFAATAEGKRVDTGLEGIEPHLIGPKSVLESGAVAAPNDVATVLHQFGLAQHTPADLVTPGQWTGMPRVVSGRFSQHGDVRAKTEAGRAAEAYTQAWRRAKLYTSTRHIFGVTQEQAIRLAAEGVLPRALGGRAGRVGAKFRRNLETLADDNGPLGHKYRELAATQGARGGLYDSTAARDIIAKGNTFQRSSALGYVKKGVEGGGEARATQLLLKPWRAYYTAIQATMRKVEQQSHDAVTGKAVAEFFGGYRSVLKMQDQTVQALIKGRFDDNMAVALASRVNDMYGNWSQLTPSVRKAVGLWSPFGLWWLNSMRWLYRLPVTHPVKTAIAAAIYNGTRNQRNLEGQGYDAAHPIPGFLQGTIPAHLPVVGDVRLGPSYYSPMGTMIQPGQTAADLGLTQFGGLVAAAKSENPLTGAKLTRKDGKELKNSDNALNFLAELVSGPTPGATQVQEHLLQKSGKPYGTANLFTDAISKLGGPTQVKPGTERSAAEGLVKMLFPTRFNFPGKVSSGASGVTPASALNPVEQARIDRATQRHEGGGNAAVEQARVKRAEEIYDRRVSTGR